MTLDRPEARKEASGGQPYRLSELHAKKACTRAGHPSAQLSVWHAEFKAQLQLQSTWQGQGRGCAWGKRATATDSIASSWHGCKRSDDTTANLRQRPVSQPELQQTRQSEGEGGRKRHSSTTGTKCRNARDNDL